ncbi:MAG: hypothetical protein MUC92_11380 [Fimbriimonadaceae bacterium]|jgi:hypothetical protein|nr:hypothetical protein [Fimbriimonadaceae bacterium]
MKETIRQWAMTNETGAEVFDTLLKAKWFLNGKPLALDPWGKRKRLAALGLEHNCDTFVETGTFLGGTLKALAPSFKKLLSVEALPALHEMNKRRLKKFSHIHLWFGGSETHMPAMVQAVEGRALFWLDGHYSQGITARTDYDCPLEFELRAIAESERKDHVIVIDDLRHFPVDEQKPKGEEDPAYPQVSKVEGWLKEINPNYLIRKEFDNIIALPPRK